MGIKKILKKRKNIMMDSFKKNLDRSRKNREKADAASKTEKKKKTGEGTYRLGAATAGEEVASKFASVRSGLLNKPGAKERLLRRSPAASVGSMALGVAQYEATKGQIKRAGRYGKKAIGVGKRVMDAFKKKK